MAETYTVLARRYRSRNFEELVGQEPIAQTLRNAITSNRVAHAFLFTGTRGVGKTSVARILAKALNCPNVKDGQPCGECPTCLAIARGEDLDVIEIDGASNNGVDQIRELRQSAGIRPARSEYKIYIIDEVHMLSGGAFNALLKTLEEPPQHVKFIFATTDVQKVPATILSRVQRYDFKNIPTPRIAEHLARICTEEQINADPEAVNRIARLGNGSMRDALSLMDRVLSLGEKHVTEKLLDELLGKPPTAAIAELMDGIAAGDAGTAINRADDLLKNGMSIEQVLGELIEFLRNLMLVAVCGEKTELLETPAELRPRFVEIAKNFDGAALVHLIALCEQTLRSLKSTTMGRPLFDALIVRLALSEQFTSIRELLRSDAVGPPGASASAPGSSTSSAPSGPGQKKNDVMRDLADQLRQAAIDATPAAPAPNPARGRPHLPRPDGAPASPVPAAAVAAPADLSDLPALWAAVGAQLEATRQGSINLNLGSFSRLDSFKIPTAEALLAIPAHMTAYATERVRAKIEEALSIVLARPAKLSFQPDEALSQQAKAAGPGGKSSGANGPDHPGTHIPKRVPIETERDILEQPIVRTIIENLGGDIKLIELLEIPEEEPAQDSDTPPSPNATPEHPAG